MKKLVKRKTKEYYKEQARIARSSARKQIALRKAYEDGIKKGVDLAKDSR